MPFKFKETVYDGREGIDRIMQELSSSLIIEMKDQIEFIKVIRFDDVLPDYIHEQANKAIAYTAEVFFNEFPELEKHFPFERPLFEANISPEGSIYEVHCTAAELTLNPGTRRGHYEYELLTFQNAGEELKKQALQDFDQLKDRFVAVIDKREGNIFRLMATDYKLDLCPFIKPSDNEQQLLVKVLNAACHEEVHYLTVPMLLKQLFSHKPELDHGEFTSSESFTYLSELMAYSIGTLILNGFLDSSYNVDDFMRLDEPYLTKAQEILLLSEGSLSRCNELIDEEIKRALDSI